MSRGHRNNNPLNIRTSEDKFDGEIQPSKDRSFKQFESMAYGYRAAFVVLGTHLSRGINTIKKIISTWAPPTENSTDTYIIAVSMLSGIDENKELTNTSGNDYVKIVAAMSYMENGIKANLNDVETGFKLQTKITY